ncbi:hypothetical protein BpHYR1_010337 [Brachionus plicatilis]|uniref:Uncharacterized protein n=1 Tax=Brachionus plicatilis TaxID=10195 RepID=A0A3M7T8R8_BRAPC|nr:hypothetical protein BpHYR1_010337 [Brachionus plicatilis]
MNIEKLFSVIEEQNFSKLTKLSSKALQMKNYDILPAGNDITGMLFEVLYGFEKNLLQSNILHVAEMSESNHSESRFIYY